MQAGDVRNDVRIVFVAAHDGELDVLKLLCAQRNEFVLGGFSVWIGELDGAAIAVLKTGVGPVLAGGATSLACVFFPGAAMVNVGISGGLVRDVAVGDIVVGSFTVNADAWKTPHTGAGLGSDSLVWLPKKNRLQTGERASSSGHQVEILDSSPEAVRAYVARRRCYADPRLVELAKETPFLGGGSKHVGGLALSQVWNSEHDRIRLICDLFDVLGEDMESHACAQIAAQLNKRPFISIRIVSNTVFGGVFDGTVARQLQEFALQFGKAVVRSEAHES